MTRCFSLPVPLSSPLGPVPGGGGLGTCSDASMGFCVPDHCTPNPFLLPTSISASSLKEQLPAPDSKEKRNLTLCTQLPAPAIVGLHLSGKEGDKCERSGTMAANLSGFRPAHRLPFWGWNSYLLIVPHVIWGFASPLPSSNNHLYSSPGSQYLKACAPSLSGWPWGISPGPLFPHGNSGEKKALSHFVSQASCQASQR